VSSSPGSAGSQTSPDRADDKPSPTVISPSPSGGGSQPSPTVVSPSPGRADDKPSPTVVSPSPGEAGSGPSPTVVSASPGSADDKPPAGPPAASGGDTSVFVVPGITRYHREGCILIRFLGADDLERMTKAEAETADCVPCKACQPDKDPT
jgi:hypothetical protein